jgi:hypothetical protein
MIYPSTRTFVFAGNDAGNKEQNKQDSSHVLLLRALEDSKYPSPNSTSLPLMMLETDFQNERLRPLPCRESEIILLTTFRRLLISHVSAPSCTRA